MTPFIAFIIVVWMQANPSAPHDRSAVIWRNTFPDQQICEIVLSEKIKEARKTYDGIKTVTIVGACESKGD